MPGPSPPRRWPMARGARPVGHMALAWAIAAAGFLRLASLCTCVFAHSSVFTHMQCTAQRARAHVCANYTALFSCVCATSIVCVRTWFGRHAEDVCAACLGAEGILRPPLAGHGVEPVQLSNRSVPAGGSARGTGTARAPTCKSNVDQAQANAERRYARMQNKSAS